MPQATFILKEPKSKEETLIYLLYRYNGIRLKYSTGWKILQKFWNGKTQRARETVQFPKHGELNTLLKNLANEVQDAHRKLINDRITVTSDRLKLALDEFQQKRNKNTFYDIISFAENWVETIDRKKNTKKQLKHAIKKLKDFKQATNASLHFDMINLDFYDAFKNFLLAKNYSTNSIGTVIKNVKVFMNEAVERKLTTNLEFRNKRFKVVEEPTETIYLNEEELKKIYEVDLSEEARLDRVRDLFIIGCYTGLRFSDLVQLRNEHISNDKIKIKTQKTGEFVAIPLHPYVREILDKYNGVPPQNISNQKMNDYLKELGQESKIKEGILISFTKGGMSQSIVHEKWKLITTHTARRSFATNAYLAGVPTIRIMQITGHRTEKSFMKYIKISQEDNANKLLSHPFFS
jgi:integrase